MQITHFRRVFSGLVKRNVGQLAVGNRDVETVAKGLDVFVSQFFGLVNIVLALADLAHAKTFDGLDQQNSGLTLVLDRSVKGGIDFLCVVTTTAQVPDVVIAHLGNHLQRARVFAEEMLANVGAVVGLHGLVVAVQRVHHDFAQGAVFVARQKGVPVAAPDQLEHVPAGTPEIAFKLLNDLAVAAHRAVQALQIAVDDEDQVVEFFTRCKADGAHGLDFVHLTVAAEHPDFTVLRVGNAAGVQVLEKASLVNGHQRAQAHGDCGELPELRHQLGMRVT